MRSSQAPRHPVTSYALACAPQVIIYFRGLLESLLNFCSGACRFYADEVATAVFQLCACLACPRGCLAVFLYTFFCPVAATTCYVTPAFSGGPIKGAKIQSGHLTPAFLGAHMRAEVRRNLCILGGPHERGQEWPAPGRQW